MEKVRISGVPEHFNMPWTLANNSGAFAKEEIDLQWTDIPEGTGRLCQMLRDNETDFAVILTEGIIKDIIAGNPSKIVQIYVESPLLWGIHVAAESDYQTLDHLKDTKVAISRPGSGSQLMAYVNAANQNWTSDDLRFETIHTIDGAVEALQNKNADYFMWERFMTKPLVDKGIFRCIGHCPTPWPSFVIVVRDEFLNEKPEIVEKVLKVINQQTATFKEIPGIIDILAERFSQKPEDVQEWLSLTHWSQNNLTEPMLNKIQNQLIEFKVTDKKGTFAEIVHQ